ncbi:BTAD domain-containing putative transcriptional regulator [Nocardia wallacei]|uniref:BTAD domain-containing putative transcriptional regulator n=1 Tax=Nocardia wallacei TaxID=480035 RepID=UPI0024577FA9|nr:BTAD domain-containing putative transcriptional regulator [Nocardia wallacei]
MAPAAPRSRSGRPLLIAVAGLGPGTGVTTTAVALAHAWPGPAVVVEADPAGGHLADLTGADPSRGLASIARAARAGARRIPIAEHLQYLPSGVGFLAAPPDSGICPAGWVTTVLTGPGHDRRLSDLTPWRELGATVVADCGVPGSALAPVLAAADACLVVVDADRTDPGPAGRWIRELAGHSRHRGVLLIGAAPGSGYAHALQVPVFAGLPCDRHAASALLHRPRLLLRRNQLLHAAHAVAATVDSQLHPPAPPPIHPQAGTAPARPPARRRVRLPGRRPPERPTVYRLELPAAAGPPPEPGRTSATPTTEPARRPPARPPQTGTGQRSRHTGDSGTDGESVTAALAGTAATETTAATVRHASTTSPGPTLAPPASGDGPGLVVQLFGPTRLWAASGPPEAGKTEITDRLQPQSLELLAVLALHAGGVSRAELLEALWGGHLPAKPGNALTNALSRLRVALAAATGTDRHAALRPSRDRDRYRLDPAYVRVDYWDFTEAVAARRRAASDTDRARACQRIVDLATAPLAQHLTHPWIEPIREAARRDALNALGWLAAHTVTTDPRTTLEMLETATETDPSNEALWQDILRLHAELGEYDALARTYTLLTRKLAEIHAAPSRETRQLYDRLRHTTR